VNPRPTRLLIIVTVFLAGVYPPVIWAALWILDVAPAAVVVPLAALLAMTGSLVGLWRPSPGGWVGAMTVFGFGWMVSATMLAMSISTVDKVRGPFDAAGLAYHTLALATLLYMKPLWSAWSEGVRPRGG